jgi:hypothetical protein
VQGNTFEQGAYLDLQNLNLPAALPVSPTNALGITGGNTFTLLQGGFGIVVRDGQTPVNDVAFDTLTGGAKADAFVFAKLGAADTITDYSGTGRQGDRMIRSGSMMPSSPASPRIRPSPFFSSHSPPAISARPSTPASASSTTPMPSGTTMMAWSAAR